MCIRPCVSDLALTHFHRRRAFPQEKERVWWTAYTSHVQPHCTVRYNHIAVFLSHDALHHCLSSNSSFENSERELRHLFYYCRSCKYTCTLTILLGECAYSTTGNSRMYYLKSGYINQLHIGFWWDTACIRSSPEVGLACETSIRPTLWSQVAWCSQMASLQQHRGGG